jgi:hypothetical protein
LEDSNRTAARIEGTEVAIEFGIAVELAEMNTGLPISLLTEGGPVIGSILEGPYEQETVQLKSGNMLVGLHVDSGKG